MDAAHLHPDRAQVRGAARDLNAHDVLHALAVAHAVPKAADAAHALGNIDIFFEIFCLHELFQPAVHKADAGYGPDHDLVLQHKVQVDGLGQHRMLRAERYDASFGHLSLTPFP